MQALELRHGAMRLALRPDLGGAIAGLWCGAVPILRSCEASELKDVRHSGCFALAPYSNRIAQARLLWNGTSHPLVQNFAPEEHAIHGVVWQRPWQVLDSSDNFAMLSYEHKGDKAWPFAFDCSQSLRLGANSLEMSLAITNQSDHPTPAGLGWHPYFAKRSRSRINFEATGRWDMGSDKLPTAHHPSHGLDVDCAFLDVDNCFDGWQGVVQLRDEALRTRIHSGLQRLVVYTNNTKDFVAIEPVSHVNNAIAMAADTGDTATLQRLGIKVLQPGESWTVHMDIRVEPVQ